MAEMTFTILAVLAACVLAYLLHSGWISRHDQFQFDPARILQLRRSREWPVTEAIVEDAHVMLDRPSRPLLFLFWGRRDITNLALRYDVNGACFRSSLKVLAYPQDRFWTRMNPSIARGEKLMIRYDPRDPSVVFPVNRTWHNGQIWRLG